MPNIPGGQTTNDISTPAAIARFLSRVPEAVNVLTGKRSFGPGDPLIPTSGQVEQTDGPRRFQYPVAANIIPIPRTEYLQLTPFEQLRNLAQSYDIASIAIATRIEEIQGLEWAIVAKNKKLQDKFEQNGSIDAVTRFFEYPDKLNEFSSWISMLLTDVLEIDAMTLYPRKDNAGRLFALEPVDGSTIKPVIDDRGRPLGYQQVLYGTPQSDYYGYGKSDPNFEPYGDIKGFFAPNELIYRPRYARTDNPYGTSPIERVIMRVNTALRKQSFDLAYFTDGNIPDMFMSPNDGDAHLDYQEVEEFEKYFNLLLAGDDRARRKVKMLPFKPGIMQQMKSFQYDTKMDYFFMQITLAALGVQPAEIGFTENVNKSSGTSQENITYRRGLRPICLWFQRLFNRIINIDLNCPDLEFRFQFGEMDDDLIQAQIDEIYLTNNVLSTNEVRSMRFANDVDGAAPIPTAVPGSATVPTNVETASGNPGPGSGLNRLNNVLASNNNNKVNRPGPGSNQEPVDQFNNSELSELISRKQAEQRSRNAQKLAVIRGSSNQDLNPGGYTIREIKAKSKGN